jgi:hypothetical protein
LKTEGTNMSCTSYTTACGDLDYVMITLINNTNGNHTVHIDTGTHNYTLVSDIDYSYFNFSGLENVVFTLTPYLSSSSSFSSSDINTYPIILTNKSTDIIYSPFFLYANISSFFTISNSLLVMLLIHMEDILFKVFVFICFIYIYIYIYIYCI